MTAVYPGVIPTASVIPSGSTQDVAANGRLHDANHNDLWAEVVAATTKIGTGTSTPAANTVLRGTGAGASAYDQIQAGDLAAGAALVKLDEQIISGAAVASVTFSSIPQTYRGLQIDWIARDDNIGTGFAQLSLRFNTDAGAVYDWEILFATAAVITAAELIGATSIRAGYVTQGGCPAGVFSAGRIVIPRYTGTVHHKECSSTFGAKTASAGGGMTVAASFGNWRSANAITSVTLLSSTGNLVAGSAFALYGLPL